MDAVALFIHDRPEFISVPDMQPCEPITAGDIYQVAVYHYMGGDYADEWHAALVQLDPWKGSGQDKWATLQSWCDTTGWDCQSGETWHIGTRDDVIAFGLDGEARRLLGLTLPGDDA